MTEETKCASLRDIMKYLGSTSNKAFTKEWKELTPEEKEWFKSAVGAIIFNESKED